MLDTFAKQFSNDSLKITFWTKQSIGAGTILFLTKIFNLCSRRSTSGEPNSVLSVHFLSRIQPVALFYRIVSELVSKEVEKFI